LPEACAAGFNLLRFPPAKPRAPFPPINTGEVVALLAAAAQPAAATQARFLVVGDRARRTPEGVQRQRRCYLVAGKLEAGRLEGCAGRARGSCSERIGDARGWNYNPDIRSATEGQQCGTGAQRHDTPTARVANEVEDQTQNNGIECRRGASSWQWQEEVSEKVSADYARVLGV